MQLPWQWLVFIGVCFWSNVTAEGQCGGSSSFPARFSVDGNGRPVLSCAKTDCFAHHAMKRCPIKFVQQSCTAPTVVTVEMIRPNASVALSRCCEFPFLQSTDPVLMQVAVRVGEHYNGGEILTDGKVTHFNLIKDIEMIMTTDDGIQFIVTANQMPCVNWTGETVEPMEDRVKVPLRAIQFQAPTARVSNPLLLPADDKLEPLQPSSGSVALPPPTAGAVAASTYTPSPFALYPFTLMTLPPLPTLPSALQPPSSRPRALQAPTYQASGSGDTAAEQARAQQWYQTWNDHYARNPTYPIPSQEEERMQFCFSGDVVAQTPNGAKLMSQLKVGDQVLVHDGNQLVYEPILAWLHRLDDQWAEFYRLQTASGQVLELTALHAVYESADCRSTKGRLTFAKDIHVGNCLVLKKEDKITITKVVNITMKWKQGIYAPLTPSGTIIANQLLTSCYSNLLVPTVHQSFYKVIRLVAKLWYWIVGQSDELMAEDLPIAVAFMANTIQDVFPLSMI